MYIQRVSRLMEEPKTMDSLDHSKTKIWNEHGVKNAPFGVQAHVISFSITRLFRESSVHLSKKVDEHDSLNVSE